MVSEGSLHGRQAQGRNFMVGGHGWASCSLHCRAEEWTPRVTHLKGMAWCPPPTGPQLLKVCSALTISVLIHSWAEHRWATVSQESPNLPRLTVKINWHTFLGCWAIIILCQVLFKFLTPPQQMKGMHAEHGCVLPVNLEPIWMSHPPISVLSSDGVLLSSPCFSANWDLINNPLINEVMPCLVQGKYSINFSWI